MVRRMASWELLRKMIVGLVSALGLLVVMQPPAAFGQAVTPVDKLDLTQFMGTWYEIARVPNKGEKRCASDAVRLYARADKAARFQLVTTCQTREGFTDVRNLDGRFADKRGDGRLKVTTFFPFSKKEWVLLLGPEYGWALVGSPNHKFLWVLSRTPAMQPGVLAAIESRAATEGYDTNKLETVSQRGTEVR